jgi:DNA modification methylase
LEETPEAYISRLTEVFTEVYRVLKPTGTLWIVIGDSYAGSHRGWGDNKRNSKIQSQASYTNIPNAYTGNGIKRKDLIGIPWMLAFSLRSAGWYLRQDIIWHKPNPMPESVQDRCIKSHEYIFLLSKSPRYYFDHKAIQELAKYDGRKDTRIEGSHKYSQEVTGLTPQTFAARGHECWNKNENGDYMRNKRDVWSVCTKPEKEAHFAVYPQELIVDCIKAGCPKSGIVLDPFMGSGTTAVVSRKLDRNYIGIELNPEYIEISSRKIRKELGLFV